MAFVQVIEFTTADIDAVRTLDAEWKAATNGTRTARRHILTRDRTNPDRYLTFVFFDSYESAMANSQLPETQAAAAKYQNATKEIAFTDLDVLSDEAL